jgi:hypothetical protein
VWQNDMTVVPAGHMLGKDFVTGFIVLAFFLTRHPCRIVTTSVDYNQLQSVLWGEMRRFIQESKYPLDVERGGPLVINHMHIRKMYKGQVDGLSYLIGRVAATGEGMSGHHIARTGDGVPRTLFVADEASGIDELTFQKASEWHNRCLIIGNPYECANTFKFSVKGRPGTKDKGGDIARKSGRGYLRKVIKIRADDSPNVRYAKAQIAAGQQPSNEILLPGVLPWDAYELRRATWDEMKQCSGLDAEFWEGKEVLMYPPAWLNRAEQLAEGLRGRKRKALAIGIDPAEGGDRTAMAAVDEYGLIELVSRKTPNTDDVPREALAFMLRHGCSPENILFDRGGGGKEHADRLRGQGYPVRTLAFGEPVSPEPRAARYLLKDKKEQREERYAYKNRRAELYGTLRELLDPARGFDWQPALVVQGDRRALPPPGRGFAIPAEYTELRQQLAPIPLKYDSEGRMVLLPKNGDDPSKCLIGLIGHSPDEADAVVLAVHAMLNKQHRVAVGVIR